MNHSTASSYLLQIDRVGTYRIVIGDCIKLAGPQAVQAADTVQFLGPLSREHAEIRRTSAGYLLTPRRGAVQWCASESSPVASSIPDAAENVAATAVTKSNPSPNSNTLLGGETLWPNLCRAELAAGVGCRLQQSSPLSRTALLRAEPENRFKDRVAGVVLLDHLLILGPGGQSHVCCPHWPTAGALIYQAGEFIWRTSIGFDSPSVGDSDELPVPLKRYLQRDQMGIYLEPMV